jgi:uncharacterized membrane protein
MAAAKKNDDALEKRIHELETRLERTEARLYSLESKSVVTFVPSRPAQAPAARPMAPFEPLPAWNEVPRTERPAIDVERMIGANWLSKLGMLVLVLGVAFFLRYAIDQGWITITARIVLGVLGGIALFATGDLLRWWDRTRFNVYAQVLAGGGAVITFFSFFASYQFPEYRAATGMTLELSSVLLAVTAAGLGLYAAIRGTPILAMEAVGLGTLASLFGSNFSGFSVIYTVLLAGAAVAAATWRRWPLVLATSVFAAYLNLLVLHAQEVDAWQLMYGTLGLLAIFTIAPLTGRAVKEGPVEGLWGFVTGGSWLAAWGLGLYSIARLAIGIDTWDGPLTGVLALGALLLALYARDTHVNARWGWAGAFVVLSLVWPALQFEGVWQSFGWAALVAAATLALWVRDHRVVRTYVAAVGVVFVGRLLFFEMAQMLNEVLDALQPLPSFALGGTALLAAWFVCGRNGSRTEPTARVVLALALTVPILYASGALDGFAVPIAWTLEAVVLVITGFMFSVRDLRLGALGMFGLVLARIFFVDLLELDLAVRIITFIAVGGLLLLASFLFARRKRGVDAPSARAVG